MAYTVKLSKAEKVRNILIIFFFIYLIGLASSFAIAGKEGSLSKITYLMIGMVPFGHVINNAAIEILNSVCGLTLITKSINFTFSYVFCELVKGIFAVIIFEITHFAAMKFVLHEKERHGVKYYMTDFVISVLMAIVVAVSLFAPLPWNSIIINSSYSADIALILVILIVGVAAIVIRKSGLSIRKSISYVVVKLPLGFAKLFVSYLAILLVRQGINNRIFASSSGAVYIVWIIVAFTVAALILFAIDFVLIGKNQSVVEKSIGEIMFDFKSKAEPVKAENKQKNNSADFVIEDGVLKKYKGEGGGVVIPDGVMSIGSWAFSGCKSLTFITIPNSVKSIGYNAFRGCKSLTGITIPDSVTSIGNGAFEGCTSLTGTTIPDSVTSIGDYAFEENLLNKASCENGVLYIGNHLIKVSKELTGSYNIKPGTKCISGGAFKDCTKLTGVTIPNGVTSIGNYAFSGCSGLTSIIIPDSVTSIGWSAFEGCTSLTDITIGNGVTSIGNEAFRSCSGLTSITIPDSVTSIDDRVFFSCISLKSITIPDSVTSIGNFAFDGCSSLTSITIPDSVTSIGDGAFSGCRNLESIIIPDSVTIMGGGVFYRCASLKNIHLPNNSFFVLRGYYEISECLHSGCGFFGGCTSLESIIIPDGVTSIGEEAFKNCKNLININIPDSVISIGENVFEGTACFNNDANWENGAFYAGKYLIKASGALTDSYDIKAGTKYIADRAFKDYTKLTDVTIPDGVISIGESAFDGCTNLTKITIPDSVTSIGSRAFENCKNLASINIPDSVTSIGGNAFCGCESLVSITIPDSLIHMGWLAFFGCVSLKEIHVSASNTKVIAVLQMGYADKLVLD